MWVYLCESGVLGGSTGGLVVGTPVCKLIIIYSVVMCVCVCVHT